MCWVCHYLYLDLDLDSSTSTQMVNRSTLRYLALNISDNMQQMLFPGNTVDLYYYLYRVGLITRSISD